MEVPNKMTIQTKFVKTMEELGIKPEYRSRVMSLLDTLREHHPATADHSMRVGLYSKMIADLAHIDPKPAIYGALHDMGKREIPLSVLAKVEGFNSCDMEVMRSHPELGYQILKDANLHFSSWIALTHHRFQRNPYPISLPEFPEIFRAEGTKLLIGLYTRIVSLADHYDAYHRVNNKTGAIEALSEERIKDMMINGNPDQRHLVEEAYKAQIFGKPLVDEPDLETIVKG